MSCLQSCEKGHTIQETLRREYEQGQERGWVGTFEDQFICNVISIWLKQNSACWKLKLRVLHKFVKFEFKPRI